MDGRHFLRPNIVWEARTRNTYEYVEVTEACLRMKIRDDNVIYLNATSFV